MDSKIGINKIFKNLVKFFHFLVTVYLIYNNFFLPSYLIGINLANETLSRKKYSFLFMENRNDDDYDDVIVDDVRVVLS